MSKEVLTAEIRSGGSTFINENWSHRCKNCKYQRAKGLCIPSGFNEIQSRRFPIHTTLFDRSYIFYKNSNCIKKPFEILEGFCEFESTLLIIIRLLEQSTCALSPVSLRQIIHLRSSRRALITISNIGMMRFRIERFARSFFGLLGGRYNMRRDKDN